MEYVDKTFENEDVTLDGNTFRNCTLRKCIIHYGGGQVQIVNCKMLDCGWQLEGPLAAGLSTIRQLMGIEGLVDMMRGIFGPDDGRIISGL